MIKRVKKPMLEDQVRTAKQNNAMHLWFERISTSLIENNIDMKMLLSVYKLDVPATPEIVKELIWRRVQLAMFGKRSTTELKPGEVTKIFDVINKFLGENWGIHVPFPSEEELHWGEYIPNTKRK